MAIVFSGTGALIRFAYSAVFTVQLGVLPGQEASLRKGKDCTEKHESRTYRHSLGVSRRLGGWEDVGPKEGATLADRIYQDDCQSATGITALVIWFVFVSLGTSVSVLTFCHAFKETYLM